MASRAQRRAGMRDGLRTLEEYLRAAFAGVHRPWPPCPQEPPASSHAPADPADQLYVQHTATFGADTMQGDVSLKHPFCVLPLDEDRLLVADYGNHRLLILCANSGRVLSNISQLDPASGLVFRSPLGLAMHSAGPLVASAAGHLSQLDNEATRIRMPNFFGLGAPELRRLCRPYGIACSTTGDVYVADSGHHRIVVLTPQGGWVSSFGAQGPAVGQLDEPRGIAIEGSHLWVADMCNHRLQCFSCEGKAVRTLGKHGDAAGSFRYPVGVAVTCGLLIVSEYVGGRLQVLSVTGAFLQVVLEPFPAREPSGCSSPGEQRDGKGSGVYLYSVAAAGKRVAVTDSAGRVHVLTVQRPCPLLLRPQVKPACITVEGPSVAERIAESGHVIEEGARKRKRLDRTLEGRVQLAVQAVDLRGVLAALGAADIQTLLAAAYADSARHPEHYHLLPANEPRG